MYDIKSKIYSVNFRDVIKSAFASITTAVFTAIGFVVNNKLKTHDFTLTMADFQLMLSVSALVFLATLSQRFVTDDQGKIFGKI